MFLTVLVIFCQYLVNIYNTHLLIYGVHFVYLVLYHHFHSLVLLLCCQMSDMLAIVLPLAGVAVYTTLQMTIPTDFRDTTQCITTQHSQGVLGEEEAQLTFIR